MWARNIGENTFFAILKPCRIYNGIDKALLQLFNGIPSRISIKGHDLSNYAWLFLVCDMY